MKALLIACVILWSGFLEAFGQNWAFQSGTVNFTIKNAGLKVNGTFSGLTALVQFDPASPKTATIEGQVETNTIETGINLRNKHLKKEEYFHVEKFPQIHMKLQQLEGSGNKMKGTFLLTMKGITKTINIPVAFLQNGNTGTLSTRFMLNRTDFGIGGSSWTMADEVEINIQFQIRKS